MIDFHILRKMVLHELFGQLKFLSLLNRFYFEASWMRKHSIKGLYIKTLRNSLRNPLELFFRRAYDWWSRTNIQCWVQLLVVLGYKFQGFLKTRSRSFNYPSEVPCDGHNRKWKGLVLFFSGCVAELNFLSYHLVLPV